MPWTYTKSTEIVVNPFDETAETVIKVNGIVIDGTPAPKERYTFPEGTTDAAIESVVEADLIAKGYENVSP